jgi:hypothetical protein
MSNATSAAPVEGGESEVPVAGLPAEVDAKRAWAQALVERARSEGVALTGEEGLLTSMVREVLQAGLDVEIAEHLGYEPYEPLGRNSGTAATAATRRPFKNRFHNDWSRRQQMMAAAR